MFLHAPFCFHRLWRDWQKLVLVSGLLDVTQVRVFNIITDRGCDSVLGLGGLDPSNNDFDKNTPETPV